VIFCSLEKTNCLDPPTLSPLILDIIINLYFNYLSLIYFCFIFIFLYLFLVLSFISLQFVFFILDTLNIYYSTVNLFI
jgi:hypothetical protein